MPSFGLFQDGLMIASVSADDRDTAFAEISHYAAVYSQDGPCTVREIDEPEDMGDE